jgi:archaellum biogenesis ATPase FlaH
MTAHEAPLKGAPDRGASKTSKLQSDLTEAARLIEAGMHLVPLKAMSKQPAGSRWNSAPAVSVVDGRATGYGLLLALNKRVSIDPDNWPLAVKGMAALGFDLEELMNAGVRTVSTRPDSGGRSTFAAEEGLGWVRFLSTAGTVLELRALAPNLQDAVPGLLYLDKSGEVRTQRYANGRRLDDSVELPRGFAQWWRRCSQDRHFLWSQQIIFATALGEKPKLSLSTSAKGEPLPFPVPSEYRSQCPYTVPELLDRHGYQRYGERWSAPLATGEPAIRLIPGKTDLYRSDHASDPLHGTFDSWVAFVVLEHGGNLDRAKSDIDRRRGLIEAQQEPREGQQESLDGDPQPLVWAELPEHPPEVPFVIPGWLPTGVVTLLAAHGGTGKSYLSIYMSICMATGRHPFEKGEVIDRVRVMLYSAEDDRRVLQARLLRYMKMMEVTRGDLEGWLEVLDATNANNVLYEKEGTTHRFRWLRERVAKLSSDVLVFDNVSDGFGGNEIDRAQVRQFMSAMRQIAPTVLLLAHVDAASSMSDPGEAKGYSGSTAWNNSARSRWFMARQKDSGEIRLRQAKTNYAAAGAEVTIQWDELHGVFAVTGSQKQSPKPADHRGVLLGLLANAIDAGMNVSPAPNSPDSIFRTLEVMSGYPHQIKQHDLNREVSLWKTAGLVKTEEFKKPNRHTGARLILTDRGRAQAVAPPAPTNAGVLTALLNKGT